MFRKYELVRVDDGEDPPDAWYFVLRFGSRPDPYALKAIATYADECEGEYPKLAADLRAAITEATT